MPTPRAVAIMAFAAACAIASPGCSGEGDRPSDRESGGACSAAATSRAAMSASGPLRPLRVVSGPVFPDDLEWRAIDGDARPVLLGPPGRDVLYPGDVALPASAPVRWRVPIQPGEFEGSERFLVAPRIGVAGVGLEALDPIVASVGHSGQTRFLEVDVDLSAVPPGQGHGRLVATLVAATPSDGAERRVESAPVQLPGGPAWLEFAIGIREARAGQGAVRFRLEACRDGGCRCLHAETLDPAEPSQRGWQDRALPLDGLGDAPFTLRFVVEPAAVPDAGESIVLGAWARPRLLVPSADAPVGRHDLILISIDTLRADHLGAYGYARETSPYMSRELAGRSTVFMQAASPATATGPSHMTLFTGLPPAVHGITSNLVARGLPDTIPTLAEILRARGYVTGAVDEDGALSTQMGFGRGFDDHRQFFARDIMKPTGFVDEVFAEGVRFLDRHPGQRFFLFLHTYEVHFPYAPPERYRLLFKDGDDPRHPDNERVGPARRKLYPVDYDREIRVVDTALQTLLRGLASDGRLDDAIVVVTADHGEAFAEHETFGHGNDVYQESVHVPLFFMGPGIAHGRRVEAPVGLIDVMPTLLDLLGVPAPAGIVGRSFAPIVLGDGDADEPRTVVTESWRTLRSASGEGVEASRTHVAYRRGPYKLIRRFEAAGIQEELYDLDADPQERRDLLRDEAAAPAAAIDAARALRGIADAHDTLEAGLVDRMRAGEDRLLDAESIPPERLEALRILGYVE